MTEGHRRRAHYLQHVPFEGLGSIRPWLTAAGYEVTGTRFFESARVPDPDEVNLLVVMGGPMSANDEGALPGALSFLTRVAPVPERTQDAL